ncbi:MAG: HYExAFE family protein [Phycisphaerae bacterium]|nr:HYExAFE family protein [Phycisphaerae bacterium]
MTVRRTHYELGFETYLDHRGTPYVAVEDVRHFTKRRTGVKAFDYIVYPPSGPACLVDVKGRKSSLRSARADCRQKNWVTRSDVSGLLTWQEVFGSDYVAMFVFAYWLAGQDGARGRKGGGADVTSFTFAGRRYSFWLVSVAEYASRQKGLSKCWNTVSVPREAFREISTRLETRWPAAPC